jgi:hypothetical protein
MRAVNGAARYSRIILGTTALLLLGLLSACGPAPAGKIHLATTEAEFGTIPNTDPVTRVFEVRNTGDGVLDITGLSTSCGCTTATVSRESLEPGEVADLTVTFDPATHNGAIGEFMRQVFVQSTDPENPEAVFTFRITVVEP